MDRNIKINRAVMLICLSWLLLITIGSNRQLAWSYGNYFSVKPGDPMPAFSLPRADGKSGTNVTLDQIKGKPGIIVFWRPEQKLSTEALRDLHNLLQDVGVDRINILAVDTSRSTANEIQNALTGETIDYPVLLDSQRELYGKVGVIVSPTTLMLDSAGIIQFKFASHPRQYRQVINARIKFLLGDINQTQMETEIEPTVLKIDHELASALRMYNLGRKLQSEGKIEQAVEIYEKAVTNYPSLAQARCALGFISMSAGDYDAAAKQFHAAITFQPTSPLARLGQAAVLSRTGSTLQAEEILLGLLNHSSISVRVRYELGRIYSARNETAKAITYYEDALRTMFPESAPGPASLPIKETFTNNNSNNISNEDNTATVNNTPADTPNINNIDDTVSSTPAIEAVVPPADAEYLGVRGCKKCHFRQWKSWKDTNMAKSMDLLKPGSRTQARIARGLEPDKDYTQDAACLKCHTTGYGHDGGYATPAEGDAGALRAAKETASVGCESCHGPGSKFVATHKDIQDKKRKYQQNELFDLGQYNIKINVCAACHQQNAPCIAPGYIFDFETRKEQGTHEHYDLNFRTQ